MGAEGEEGGGGSVADSICCQTINQLFYFTFWVERFMERVYEGGGVCETGPRGTAYDDDFFADELVCEFAHCYKIGFFFFWFSLILWADGST
jgi:hypothetical protein